MATKVVLGSKLQLTLHTVSGSLEASLNGATWGEWIDESPGTVQEYVIDTLPLLLDLTARNHASTLFDVVYSIGVTRPDGGSIQVTSRSRLKSDGQSTRAGKSFDFLEAP